MRPASPSSVAEKNSVCRSAGHRATMRSTAGRKPMSSMRSASSSTSVWTWSSVKARRWSRSSSRPGVATTMWARRARASASRSRRRRRRRPTRRLRPRARAAQLVDDLAGQLTRRGEHQRRRAARVGRDAVDQRHAEGERLAGAGGRLGQDVVAGEHVGDDELLDGEGRVDAALDERTRNRTRHAEIGEGLLGHWRDFLRRKRGRERFGRRLLTRTAVVAGPKQANCLAAGKVPTTAHSLAGLGAANLVHRGEAALEVVARGAQVEAPDRASAPGRRASRPRPRARRAGAPSAAASRRSPRGSPRRARSRGRRARPPPGSATGAAARRPGTRSARRTGRPRARRSAAGRSRG